MDAWNYLNVLLIVSNGGTVDGYGMDYSDMRYPSGQLFDHPEGKLFTHYNEKADGTGNSHYVGDQCVLDSIKVVYAIFEEM